MEFIHDDTFKPVDLECTTTPEGRRYKTPSGELYESITTALGKDPKKEKSLMEWRERVGAQEANRISRLASTRGTAMHTICENYLNNEQDYIGKAMPNAVVMFRTIQPILDKAITRVYMQECSLYSDVYRLAGRVDCIADIKGKLSVLDFKTSTRTKKRERIKDYYLQTAAYSFMFEEMYGKSIDQVVIIIAVENENPQIFIDDPYKYKDDSFFQERIQ